MSVSDELAVKYFIDRVNITDIGTEGLITKVEKVVADFSATWA